MGTEIVSREEKRATFKVAFITGATIFIMGYVNALALQTEQLGMMVTPQTGNVIWMGLNPAFGNWSAWISNLALFFGFIFGCAFAYLNQNLIKHKTGQFFLAWALFTLPVALYPFYMPFINSQVAFLAMGLSAGFGVGFFRKMYHLEINNAMATGNVRFVGTWFAEAFIRGQKKSIFTFALFVLCVFLFAFGAFIYGLAHNLDARGAANFSVVRIALIVFCIIPCFFAPKNTPEQK